MTMFSPMREAIHSPPIATPHRVPRRKAIASLAVVGSVHRRLAYAPERTINTIHEYISQRPASSVGYLRTLNVMVRTQRVRLANTQVRRLPCGFSSIVSAAIEYHARNHHN